MKRYSEAKFFILKAIEHGESKNPVIIEHMSKILYELGEIDESIRYMEIAENLRKTDKQ